MRYILKGQPASDTFTNENNKDNILGLESASNLVLDEVCGFVQGG